MTARAKKQSESSIVVSGLTKCYGRFKAVDEVSFRVEQGEIVGFLGPNGAGKSTVMKVLTCYLSATSGEVRVAGHDGYREPLEVRRKVGYHPENVPLYDEMVVYDYLLFMARMRGVSRGSRGDRIAWVARTCGLKPMMGRQIGELSKGYRQRVGLAQALVHDPQVLILDEPMAGLDPNQIIEIRDLIKEIGSHKTIIFSTHVLQEIEKICDRILIIHQGRIIADGTIDQLTRRIQHQRRFRLSFADATRKQHQEIRASLAKHAAEVTRAAGQLSGTVGFELQAHKDEDIRPAVFAAITKGGWTLLEMRELVPTLEDVFRDLTGTNDLKHSQADPGP